MRGRIAALSVLLLLLASLQAYGETARRLSPSEATTGADVVSGELTVAPKPEKGTYSVVGYIEEVRGYVITLHGVDYDIRGARIKDAAGNSTDMDLFEVGANVEVKFKKDKISEVILIQTSKAEGR